MSAILVVGALCLWGGYIAGHWVGFDRGRKAAVDYTDPELFPRHGGDADDKPPYYTPPRTNPPFQGMNQ